MRRPWPRLSARTWRVVIASPKQVRIIAHAKIKTDTIDAGVLAQLYASGFLPEVWIPAPVTEALRRQVARRNQIVKARRRLGNIVQSILHAHLIPPCPAADLFGHRGRAWLAAQALPDDERLAIERHAREIDRLGEDLTVIGCDLAHSALIDGRVKRLRLMANREKERRRVEQAEQAYARFVTGWTPRGPKARTGAAKEERRSRLHGRARTSRPCSSPRGRPCAGPF